MNSEAFFMNSYYLILFLMSYLDKIKNTDLKVRI